MKTKFNAIGVFYSMLASLPAFAADAPPDLTGLIRAAEKASAGLSAAQIQEKVSEARVSVRQGDYLPSLEFDAADSWGYPGSSGSMGIPGLAGSPFRAGAGADLLLSGTIWDFGRTNALVKSAEHDVQADKADSEVKRGEVDHEAVTLYFECVRYRSQMEAWAFVAKEASRVDREVQKFVSTGQRSIVDKYLARAQVEQAETARSDYEARYLQSQRRLEILTALPHERIECPAIEMISGDSIKVLEAGPNPALKRDDEKAKAADSRVSRVKADYLPKLKGYATAGMLQDSHVVAKDDYAFGVGFVFPLFDGFKTINGVKEAQADAQRQESLLEDTRYRVDQANAKYDQLIESARTRMTHVEAEVQTVEQGFSVARDRYFTLHGTLVDLREALRDLSSVRGDLIDTKTSLFAASLEKEIFNGSRVKP